MRLAASPRRRALAAVTATTLLATGLQLLGAGAAQAAETPRLTGGNPPPGQTVQFVGASVTAFFSTTLGPVATLTVEDSLGTVIQNCDGTPGRSTVANNAGSNTGAVSCALTRSLDQDRYTVSYTVTDNAFPFETATGSYGFVVDSGPSSASTTPSDGSSVPRVDTVVASFVERIRPESSTAVLRSGGNQLAGVVTSQAGPPGTITFDPAGGPLPDGTYEADFSGVDTNGNTTPVRTRFTVDSQVPVAPTLTVPPRFREELLVRGTGEPGAIVTVTATQPGPLPLPPGPTASATATVTMEGTYSTTLDLTAFDDGEVELEAVQRDAARNTSPAATATSVKDSTAPVMPTVVVDPTLIGPARERSVVVTGQAEAGSTVTLDITEDGARTGALGPFTTTAAGNGTYRFEGLDVSSLEDGALEFTVQARDAAGNPSQQGQRVVQKDTAAPVVTGLRTDRPLYSAASSQMVVVTGSTQAGSTVVVRLSDTAGRTATQTVVLAPTATTFSVTFDARTFADGELTAAATATDRAGNTGPAATTTAIKDGTPPRAPTQGQGDVDAGNAGAYRVFGVTEPGATVTVTIDDQDVTTPAVTVTVRADSVGSYDSGAQDVSGLRDGQLTVTAVATDRAGNTATSEQPRTKDVSVPRPVQSVEITPDPVTQTRPGGAVELTVSGQIDAADQVSSETYTVDITVRDGRGTSQTLPAVVSRTGAYTVTFDVQGFVDGPVTATAVVVDRVRNTSAPVTDTATKNTTVLARQSTDPADGSTVRSARSVSATYSEPLDQAAGRSTVVVRDRSGTALAGQVTFADQARTIVFTPAGGSLSDGGSPYTATFDVRDRAVERSTTAITFTVSGTAPPTVMATNPVTAANDDAFNVNGTTEPGATVTVTVVDSASNTVVLEAVAGRDGRYSVTRADVSGLADGPLTVRAVARFTDGNESRTASTTVVKDTRGPQLVASSPRDGDTVQSPQDVDVTFDEQVGDVATATVRLRGGAAVRGAVSTTDGGRTVIFTRERRLADGVYDVVVDVTDQVGNPRRVSFSFTVDNSVTQTPGVTAPETVNAAQAATYTVLVTSLPGATVTVNLSGPGAPSRTQTFVADDDGETEVRFGDVSAFADGTLLVRAVAQAGNRPASGTGSDTTLKDTAAPAAPTVDLPPSVSGDARNVLVEGTAEPGATATVTIIDSASRTVVLELLADERGMYAGRANLSGLADGPLTAVATATDRAGNTSRPSQPDTTTKDTAGPAAPTVVLSPVNAANAATATVTGRADTSTAVLTVSVDDDDPATPAVVRTVVPDADGTYSLVVDVRDLRDGTLTATVTPTDGFGNVGPAGTTTARKDTVAPGVVSTTPATGTVVTTVREIALLIDEDVDAAGFNVFVDGRQVTGDFRIDDGRRVVFTLDQPITRGFVQVAAGVRDPAGNSTFVRIDFTVEEPASASPSPSPVTPQSPSPAPTTPEQPTPGPVSPSPTTAPPSPSPTTASPSPSTSPSPSPTVAPRSGAGYVGLASPVRVLDSRTPVGTTRGPKRGAVVLDLSSRVPADATAAVLNLTVTNPTANGFVVVYPSGNAKPGTSNVNFLRGQTQANEVVVGLPADKRVVVFVDSASANVIADLVGSFTTGDPATTGRVVTQAPERVLDTRTGLGAARGVKRGAVVLDLSGQLPAGTTSVALNVTVTGTSARGFVVAFPTGTTKPGTSNVNFERGQTQANEVVTRVGTNGRVTLFVDSASAHVIADLVATIVPRDGSGAQLFTALAQPQRVLDSRAGSGNVGTSPGRKSGTVVLTLPAGTVPGGATGVVLNVTTTGANKAGFVAVYPTGSANPGTSNVNFRVGANQANEVLTAINGQRQVTLFVGGSGAPQTHVIADVVGYLTPAG